jgi:hypothetical protein
MTGLWLFANVVLPVALVALGYAAVRFNERHDRHLPPGE